MSYDIYFLKREPGQSWEEAIEGREEREERGDDGGEATPANWDEIVFDLAGILGEVSVREGPPSWQIGHEPTGTQLECVCGEWTLTVPYCSDGDTARKVIGYLRAIAQTVQAATGLDAYDPQAETAVTTDGWAGRAGSAFDEAIELFNDRSS